jgi:hypothetical protein
MQINMTVWGTGSTLINNKLRYKAYEAAAPTAEVASLTEDPPHTFPHAVTINVPNPVVHIVKIFSTPDDSTGTLISEFIYDPTYTNVEVRIPLELAVGGSGEFDPITGTQSIPVIPSLRGWDWHPEMRSKSGTLSITEYTKTESTPGEGYDSFSLVGDDQFYAPDFVFIHFKPKISVSQPVFTYLNLYNGVKEITGSEIMDATYYRMLCEIVTSGTSPVIQLLPKANVPDNTLLVFSMKRGAQKQATLKAATGETIECDNEVYPAIFLGQGEVVWLWLIENKWRVANDWSGMQKVGIQVDMEVIRPNTIVFNGGGLVDGGGGPLPLPVATYPRVEWYCNTKLLPGQLITKDARDAGGDALSGFWAYDEVGNLWAPDYGGASRRALPGTRGNDSTRDATTLAGSYRADQLKKHRHHIAANEKETRGSTFPPQVDANTHIPAQLDFNNNTGGASTYLAATATEATVGLTSEGGDATETVGKTVGTIAGCYI